MGRAKSLSQCISYYTIMSGMEGKDKTGIPEHQRMIWKAASTGKARPGR